MKWCYSIAFQNNQSSISLVIPEASNTSCIYWCWCSVLGGFITPADSSSTSLGIGLSIALKAERGIPDWLWGAVAQWSEHLQLKQEALGSIPSGCPGYFLFQLAYTNVNGMKDLWCSSTQI